MIEPAVKLVNITKQFPGVIANNAVNFEVLPGEIHALLGENGAGKSTLMNILIGLYKPEAGRIELSGRPVEFKGPADAIAQGVGVVFQHFKLVPNLTVAENVALGMRRPRFVLSLAKIERELSELSQKLDLPVNAQARVSSLSVGEQQRVEIIKTLYLGAKILALDEPTANLTPQESQNLFVALRKLAAEGYAIIFISHKLQEVVSLANRATILRGGRSVATVEIKNEPGEKEKLASLMIGRQASGDTAHELGLTTISEVAGVGPGVAPPESSALLQVSRLTALNNTGQAVLKDLNFGVAAGEIVVIVGVAGNGQRELAEVLSGLRPAKSGTITLGGRSLANLSPRQVSRLGVAFVPEDRLSMGLAPGLDLEDNYLLREYWRPRYRRGPFVRRNVARQDLGAAIRQYDIAVGDPFAPARLLSGGNLQKLMLARELSAGPQLLIVANPTRGLDIGASAYVHQQLRAVRDRGAALLLVLEDLDEALSLADRLLVMYEGRLMGELPPLRTDDNLQKIGLLMAGSPVEDARR